MPVYSNKKWTVGSIGIIKGGNLGYCIRHRELFVCCVTVDNAGHVTMLLRNPARDDETEKLIETGLMVFKEMLEKGLIKK